MWVIAGVTVLVGCLTMLLVLMARATPAQVREETHRMGNAHTPGPGGLYDVPSDADFKSAWREFHPDTKYTFEPPSLEFCVRCLVCHAPGQCVEVDPHGLND